LTQKSRVIGAVVALLLLGFVLSACGATPVAQNWPGLTVAGDTVYLISGLPQKVFMLDAETGTQKGAFIPQGEHSGVLYWSPVTEGGDLAFVGFAEPQEKVFGLYAFDPATGSELWHVPTEDLILPAPTYADGVVYFGSSDKRVYAVDVESRQLKAGWPFETEEAIWASPLVADGRVYVVSMDHHLYCLDAETGQEIWSEEVGGAMAAQPTLEDGILYVGAFDGQVHAIHADTGKRVEGFDSMTAGNWIWSEVLVADGQLFVTSLDGKLYALDPATGASLPSYPYDSGAASDTQDGIRAAPVQAGEYVVVATQAGWVRAIQNAQPQWIWPSGGAPQAPVLTTPVVSGGRVYVALIPNEGPVQLQTLDAETGSPGWVFTPSEGQ
jgi:outer membrane protein assembly factor BamB